MTYTFKLSRRIAMLRAALSATIVLAVAGCNSTDTLNPDSSAPDATPGGSPALATSNFAGGIPFGIFAQPTTEFGSRYNGAMRNIAPHLLLRELADIKARGGRTALMFAGNEGYYKDGSGHFSFDKWRARVDRFKGINFSSYLADGTIIGHYMIDEPNDPANWNGQPIPGAMVEEMAKYSKSLWPDMVTIVRAEPGYFDGTYKYLDVAWAQYLGRKGSPEDFLKRNVADAQSRGLGLIVGVNFLKGGTPNGSRMTASQLEAWGSALLASGYPCAFISWTYDDGYLGSSGVAAAMDALRSKAQNRAARSCAGSTQTPPAPAPPPPASPPPASAPPPGTSPATTPLPFGLSHMPIEDYSTRWSGSVYRADPADLVKQLDRAAAIQAKLIVVLANPGDVKSDNGTFSLTKWKAEVDRYRGLPLGKYIGSKTLYLHHLVDQPDCTSCWGGQAISWKTVETMAKYSKSIWPDLATSVRVAPTTLAAASFRWTYLDAGWAEYETSLGDIKTWLGRQVASAKSEGLGLVAGLNLMDATGLGSAPMTASQIQQFGTVLAKEPSVCALVGWRYDPAYLSQSGVGAALDAVAAIARTRNAGSCVVN